MKKKAVVCSTAMVLPNENLSHGPSCLNKCSAAVLAYGLLPTWSFALPSFVFMTSFLDH